MVASHRTAPVTAGQRRLPAIVRALAANSKWGSGRRGEARSRGRAAGQPRRPESKTAGRPLGQPYRVHEGPGGRGVDSEGSALFFDMVAMGSPAAAAAVPVRLLRMRDLGPDDDRDCPIGLDAFDRVSVDFVPAGTPLFEALPDRCVAELPCGHKFAALPLACHAAVGGMRCPVCRRGVDRPMRQPCLPAHIRMAMLGWAKRAEEQRRREALRAEIALRMMVFRPAAAVFDMASGTFLEPPPQPEARSQLAG